MPLMLFTLLDTVLQKKICERHVIIVADGETMGTLKESHC